MSALVATVLAMLVLDGLWLGLVARGFYPQHLGFLMTDQVNWGAAGLFYLLYAIGLTVFVTMPGVDGGSVGTALWRGALFGLVAYATYDLTNQATLKGWPFIVTAVDLVWGMLLSAAVGAIATYAVLRFS